MTPENICVPKQTIPIGSEGEFPSDLYLMRGQWLLLGRSDPVLTQFEQGNVLRWTTLTLK